MIRRPRSAALSLLSILVLSVAIAVGCGGGASDDDDDGGGDDDDDGGPTCTPILSATLTTLQAAVFTSSCATLNCHDNAGASISGQLNLTAGQARGEMLGVNAIGEFNMTTLQLVDASDANLSYVVKKVRGTTGIDGLRMPQGLPALCEEKIQALEAWIEAGAPNN